MTARGEIGFLIASLAQSKGIFKQAEGDDANVYLIAIWAIVLCTIAGPIIVGALVRDMKKTNVEEERDVHSMEMLGSWGIAKPTP